MVTGAHSWHAGPMKAALTRPTGAMTRRDLAVIYDSLEDVKRKSERAAALFYGRLFEFDPSLRSVSDNQSAMRDRAFIQALADLVKELEHPQVRPGPFQRVKCTGRFASYLRSNYHHLYVGAALFWMLPRVLGKKFTANAYGAWMKLYHATLAQMKQAALDAAIAA